jgi:hypothetical protein
MTGCVQNHSAGPLRLKPSFLIEGAVLLAPHLHN